MIRSHVMLLAATALAGLAGCGDATDATPGGPGPNTNVAPIVDTPARGGAPANGCDATTYPCGPYGFYSGDVLPNLAFLGRADDDGDGNSNNDPVRRIQLSDFYKDKSIKALAILVSAEWCGP